MKENDIRLEKLQLMGEIISLGMLSYCLCRSIAPPLQMTLRSSNIYWEESTHTEGKSDRKQEDLMTLQHEKVVKGSLRSQNMKKKKLLAAMSSFEVSLKSMESTLYSTSRHLWGRQENDHCFESKPSMEILSMGGDAASTVQERDAGLFQTGNVTLVRHNLQNPS